MIVIIIYLFIHLFEYSNAYLFIFIQTVHNGGRERAVDERLNIARIYIGRAPRGVSKNFNLCQFTYDGSKILKGFTHFIPNKAKEAILETITDFHAVLPETGVRVAILMECEFI